MQGAVNTEPNVGLKFSAIVQDLDIYYLKSYFSSHNTFSKV